MTEMARDIAERRDGTDAHPEVGATVKIAAERLIENVERVMIGTHHAVKLVTVALLCEGHVLLEDVPGVGKTLLAKAFARSLSGGFKRIQFTPDLLPSDVTGINVFDQKLAEFRFRAGPLMANIVLADEINRATPRTQSCLLEAMEERQVTIDAETHRLPRPFLVLATQNPIEQEGTFPLPEAQLDRFLMNIRQGYPDASEEEEIVLRFERTNPLDALQPVLSGDELAGLQALCRQVVVEASLRAYIVAIVRATREHPDVRMGASPRATQRLYQATQALAAVEGRDFVVPDDVKALAGPVLAHRISIRSESRFRGDSREGVIAAVLETIPVPVS